VPDPSANRQGVWVWYWIHLAIPLVLAANCIATWPHGGHANRSVKLVLAGSFAWLLGGIAFYFVGRRKPRISSAVASFVLLVFSTLFAVAAVELSIRLFLQAAHSEFFPRPPHKTFVLSTTDQITPGLAGKKLFTTNEFGLRGPALPTDKKVYRIVTVGGSTTECLYLDDSEEWSHLLMTDLNDAGRGERAWVANAGVAAHTTVHHLRLMQTLPVFSKVNMAVFLTGINDLIYALAYPGAATQTQIEARTKLKMETGGGPFFTRSKIYQTVSSYLANRSAPPRSDDASLPTFYWQRRVLRKHAEIVPIPNIDIGLAEYRERILRLTAQCRQLGLRCLFLTQPTMWREGLTPEETDLLWFGWVGMQKVQGFGSVPDLQVAMDRYNRVLMDTCHEAGMECLDLAAAVPKSTEAFFDDCHFNRNGARLVAAEIARYLLSRSPFAQTASAGQALPPHNDAPGLR
jgi:hypothetical protein